MTGIIVELTRERRSGAIRAQDGSRVVFPAAAVEGEFEQLAVGHRVRFEMDVEAPAPRALRVRRETAHPSAAARKPALDLRYAGFDQQQNVRRYRFASVAAGLAVRQFVVTVDLGLLVKHHIGMQEIPALCLRKLTADLERDGAGKSHELGNDDLAAYASSRAAAAQRKKPRTPFHGKRGTPPPGPPRFS